MGLFKKKKSEYILLKRGDQTLYEGKWEEIPFTEDVIIEKSIAFFDDSCPCYIHRNAVRVRLLAELEELKKNREEAGKKQIFFEQLCAWMGFEEVTDAVISER